MRGAAVEKDHLLTLKLDRDRGNLSHGPGTDTFGAQLIELARVWENAQVKLGGLSRVVIKPEEWRNFVHDWHAISQRVASGRPTCGKSSNAQDSRGDEANERGRSVPATFFEGRGTLRRSVLNPTVAPSNWVSHLKTSG